jgi:hypothetical protein
VASAYGAIVYACPILFAATLAGEARVDAAADAPANHIGSRSIAHGMVSRDQQHRILA